MGFPKRHSQARVHLHQIHGATPLRIQRYNVLGPVGDRYGSIGCLRGQQPNKNHGPFRQRTVPLQSHFPIGRPKQVGPLDEEAVINPPS